MKKKHKLLLFLCMGLLCLMVIQKPVSEARASNPVLFQNLTTGSKLFYEKEAVQYQYNGAKVNFNGNIGLLGESGSALAPMGELFVNSLGVDCTLRLSDSSVTLSDGSKAVTLHPGSGVALVNGTNTEIGEPPVLMKNKDGELLYYVPTRFIASNLGFSYEWNKTLSTVFISKSDSIRYRSEYTEQPIEIPLSKGITLSDIRLEDRYYDGKFAVYIPGNHVREYENNAITNHYSVITGMELALTGAHDTVVIFELSRIMACKPEVKNNTLYLTFVKPRELYSKIVVVDPGHGGYDPGAIREKKNESDLNLSIAYEHTKDLFEASDIKVYYTRVQDKFISLNDRAAFASKVGADFFVSVHQNTFTSTGKQGTSVYYSSDNKNVGAEGLTGRLMAGILADSISSKLNLKNLGRLNQRLSVTTYNTVPAALVELAFMSNPDDFARLQDEEFRKKAGQVLFETIQDIFEAYPTKR